jgi:hypothetical protein
VYVVPESLPVRVDDADWYIPPMSSGRGLGWKIASFGAVPGGSVSAENVGIRSLSVWMLPISCFGILD